MPQAPLPATMIETLFPDQANHVGTLFGAHAFRLADKAVFVAVSRHARKMVGTDCSETFVFQTLVPRGRRIGLAARIVATECPAMTVRVKTDGGELAPGGTKPCAQGRFGFALNLLTEGKLPCHLPEGFSAGGGQVLVDRKKAV